MALTEHWTLEDARRAGSRGPAVSAIESQARDWLVHRLYTERKMTYRAMGPLLGISGQRAQVMHKRHLQRERDSSTIAEAIRGYARVLRKAAKDSDTAERLGIPQQIARDMTGGGR